VAELIAIGYDDEETASRAAEDVYRLEKDLIVDSEAVAVIVRDKEGRFKVTTNHHPVAEGFTWGMFWGALFGLIFFVPLFGVVLGGAFGALFGAIEKAGIDLQFQREVRDMLTPGTSALFLIVEKVTTDKALAALSKYGGKVLKSSLSADAERQIQEALHGSVEPGMSEAVPAGAAAGADA
jgi:uncharacterized membrane protein